MQNSTILNNVSPTDLQTMMEAVIDSKLNPVISKLSGTPDGDELLSRNAVCELLQVDLSTLHHWRKKGKIKASAIGSRVYFRRSDIDNALIPLT